MLYLVPLMQIAEDVGMSAGIRRLSVFPSFSPARNRNLYSRAVTKECMTLSPRTEKTFVTAVSRTDFARNFDGSARWCPRGRKTRPRKREQFADRLSSFRQKIIQTNDNTKFSAHSLLRASVASLRERGNGLGMRRGRGD